MASDKKSVKEEKAARARSAADGYRQSLANVRACEAALDEAKRAQYPFIEELVSLKGNSVKLRLDDGNEVMAKFRKDRSDGYIVSHEALDGEAI